MKTLVTSTAPDILGYEIIKAALLCSIVSGADNPQNREYIHMILCGDPGTGKSALLRYVRALVPRSQYSAGKGSSVAGLTVAVVKDELSGSGYTAQAGALVLADRGLMVLDEVDKLEKEDFQALNTALEESFIEVHKGGINQKFNTRCPVIALCNPKNSRFEPEEPFTKQISIPGDTLSRFDLVFKILDIPDKDKDREIAQHQARQWARYGGSDQEQPEERSLSQEKLSKYLQYAKMIKPRTTPEADQILLDYYLTLRKPDDSGTIATTARQFNGLYRLTKAIAKLRLSDTCSKEDAEKTIQIHKASLEALRDPTTGKIDNDILSGMGKSQRDRYRQIRDIIQDLQGNNGSSAHYNDIIAKAEEKHIGRDQAKSDFDYLKHTGEIIEVSNGFYRVI
jgi:replicative DNA helicase Mcm